MIVEKEFILPVGFYHGVLDEDIEFLEHFGIKGQKWGKRKKEDTASSDSKASEPKTSTQSATEKEPSFVQRHKKALIGAGVAAGVLVVYGGIKMNESGELPRKIQQVKAFASKSESSWKMKPILADPNLNESQIHALVSRSINPEFGKPGTKMNCKRCTYAYEMRRRGFDVKATKSMKATGQNLIGDFNIKQLKPGENIVGPGRLGIISRTQRENFEKELKGKKTPFTDFLSKVTPANAMGDFVHIPKTNASMEQTIFEDLKRTHPNKARGELTMFWKGGGGHSVSWEMINDKPVIFDNQTGKMFRNAEEMRAGYKNSEIAHAGNSRLDNIPLNHDFLQRWVTNA